jgi:phage/plasmid-associated DNA primase
MKRVANFLKYKGAKKVYYSIVPGEVNGTEVKGVDDYFAAGGTLDELKAAREGTPPKIDTSDDAFSDSILAETIADELMTDKHIWVKGLGWMTWDGRKWCQRSDESVTEDLRQYCIDQLTQAVEALKSDNSLHPVVDGWRSMLKRHRLTAVIGLAKGIVERQVSEMDADPDVLNTPSGVVDLDTGELHPHDPTLLMTKITSGCYRPGYTHPDWEKALEALPTVEQEWFQVRVGQGITGHTTPDGVMPVMQGTGENGKSVLTTDGLVPALGDYASMASPKLFQFSKGSEHSEERATLQGIRVLIAEELTEGRSIDITALKQIQDVGMITARHVFQKNMTFRASHSLSPQRTTCPW